MPFYMWEQNNSGGSFRVDDKLTHRLVIEADTYREAEYKAFDMGVYYNGVEDDRDCSCCGDRWYEGREVKLPIDFSENIYGEGKDGLKVVGRKENTLTTLDEYLQYLTNRWGWETPDARVFYKNGSVKEFSKVGG